MTLLNSVEEDYDKKYNKIEKEKRGNFQNNINYG